VNLAEMNITVDTNILVKWRPLAAEKRRQKESGGRLLGRPPGLRVEDNR
jgi:hypothetical protein